MDIMFVKMPDTDRARRIFWAVTRRQVRIYWSVGAGIAVVGALMALIGFASDGGNVGPLGFAFFVCGVWILCTPWLLLRRVIRRAGSQSPPDAATVRLTDDEAVFETPLSQGRFNWPIVKRIDECDGFWIAYRDRQVLFSLPQDSMTSEQITEFREFLARRF